MSTITIPSTLAESVRLGAHVALGTALEQLATLNARADRETAPERYSAPLARFDDARALLDRIGWGVAPPAALALPDGQRRALLVACVQALQTADASGDLAAYAAALHDTEGQ
jgi:hypothetical protein